MQLLIKQVEAFESLPADWAEKYFSGLSEVQPDNLTQNKQRQTLAVIMLCLHNY